MVLSMRVQVVVCAVIDGQRERWSLCAEDKRLKRSLQVMSNMALTSALMDIQNNEDFINDESSDVRFRTRVNKIK